MNRYVEIILRGSQYKQLLEAKTAELRKEYKLKRIETDVLCCLARSGENNTSASVCRKLNANKGHISQAVENLCKRDLLIAMPDEFDRRYVHYILTPEAKEIADEFIVRREKFDKELFASLSKQELEKFKIISEKLVKNMECL